MEGQILTRKLDLDNPGGNRNHVHLVNGKLLYGEAQTSDVTIGSPCRLTFFLPFDD
jgi:hypothetical protein